MTDQPSGRVIEQQCEGCENTFTPSGFGRPPKYCTDACRQRAWALRTATRMLQTGQDPRPKIVEHVVERVVEVERGRQAHAEHPRPQRPNVPTELGGWLDMLARLREQLEDDRGQLARQHWHHRALFERLVLVSIALGKAHPGGLTALQKQRPRR